jgi:hypothetical protein
MSPASENKRISPEPIGNMREKYRKPMEHGSSILDWISSVISDRFQRERTGSHRKNLEISGLEYCFYVPSISRVVLPKLARISSPALLYIRGMKIQNSSYEYPRVQAEPIG